MSKFMQTTGVDSYVIEIKGQRVVSYKQIAELHQVEVKTYKRTFKTINSTLLKALITSKSQSVKPYRNFRYGSFTLPSRISDVGEIAYG
jgi:hypothetical protein